MVEQIDFPTAEQMVEEYDVDVKGMLRDARKYIEQAAQQKKNQVIIGEERFCRLADGSRLTPNEETVVKFLKQKGYRLSYHRRTTGRPYPSNVRDIHNLKIEWA